MLSQSSLSTQTSLRRMMKLERDKKFRHRNDYADEPDGEIRVIRGILKPTSNVAPMDDVSCTVNGSVAPIQSLNYDSDNSVCQDEKKFQRNLLSGEHDPFKNVTNPIRSEQCHRRVAFKNNVTVTVFQTESEDEINLNDRGDADVNSEELDDFFQSIDEIASVGGNVNSYDRGSNINTVDDSLQQIIEKNDDSLDKGAKIATNKRKVDTDLENDIDTRDLEQAAYEARLARLLLLRSKQDHPQNQNVTLHLTDYIPTVTLPNFIDTKTNDDSDPIESVENSSKSSLKSMIRQKYTKEKIKASETDDSFWNTDLF